MSPSCRIRISQKGRQRSLLLKRGTEFIQFHAVLEILHQDDLNNRMNRRTDTWRNGCFRKTDDHPVCTTPNHHPPQLGVLKKNSANHPSCQMASEAFKSIPQRNSDDLCLPFCLILILYASYSKRKLVTFYGPD